MAVTSFKILNAIYLSIVLIVGASVVISPHIPTQLQAQLENKQIQSLDNRIEKLESADSKVEIAVAVIEERTKIDHEILLGIALAVIGMGLETAWRTMKFGKEPPREVHVSKHKEDDEE
jgi:hypothetical protein